MKNPNLNKIIAENLDKSKFQSKSVPSLPTDSWLNQYKDGGETDPTKPYHPITNPDGYKPSNQLERIQKLSNKEKRYEPTNAVKNLKSTLAVASLAGSGNPFTQYLAQVAGGTGDLYTAGRYAADQNWSKAKEDAVQGVLGFIPYAKAIPGMKIGTDYFTKGARLFNTWLKRAHGASDIKTLTESPTPNYPVHKMGGGIFPPYHSWAPPRHANGGDISVLNLEDGLFKKSYNPKLGKKDHEFLEWYAKNTLEGQRKIPFDSSEQVYDFYSYFKNTPKSQLSNPEAHFPDTYKYPNHPTFSNESIYSTPEKPGGKWDGETYIKKGKFIYKNGGYMFANGGKFITVDGEYHRVYENRDGDIVVNHPKEDKGKWDTINLTDKANAKTVADGVKSVKKWHKENPETKAKGGWLNKYI